MLRRLDTIKADPVSLSILYRYIFAIQMMDCKSLQIHIKGSQQVHRTPCIQALQPGSIPRVLLPYLAPKIQPGRINCLATYGAFAWKFHASSLPKLIFATPLFESLNLLLSYRCKFRRPFRIHEKVLSKDVQIEPPMYEHGIQTVQFIFAKND